MKLNTITSDPIADFERFCNMEDDYEKKLPICDNCGQPIVDEYCYEVGDELFCEDCMTELFRRDVEDFMSE